MNNLIFDITENLTLDDIEVLNNLIKDEALNRFSAKPKQTVLEETKISESFLRKSIVRLQASTLIRVAVENRKQVLYVTGNGHGVMKLNQQIKDYEQFQGAIVSIDKLETAQVFENIKKSFKGEKVEGIKIEKQEEEEVKEEPIIKMKRIIAETGEKRVGELRKLMEMNINVVTDLMRQLATESWLITPEESESKKWELNEECEELNKLRQMYGGK